MTATELSIGQGHSVHDGTDGTDRTDRTDRTDGIIAYALAAPA